MMTICCYQRRWAQLFENMGNNEWVFAIILINRYEISWVREFNFEICSGFI
jgi:hypothetical protein